jgi:hypothetical protein
MAKEPEKIDRNTLDDRLSKILTKGSLYRPIVYKGEGVDFVQHLVADPGQQARFGFLPKTIRMFCKNERCKAEQWWEVAKPQYYLTADDEPSRFTYTCKNCGHQTTDYWLVWKKVGEVRTFTKVGQWPPLTIEPSVVLSDALGKEDAALYKKALINASFSHGIAALAYFRRVIENKVNVLLDLVADAAKAAEVDPADLQQLEEIKNGKHVDVKIDYAAKILPAHLRPGGHNPLERLYGIASAGLHGESDDDCLSRFQDYKHAFEYLFENLTEQNEHAKEYIKQLSKPIPSKTLGS